MKGLFITFEGTEGCGKSTQIKKLSRRLRAQGRAVTVVREPGGTPIGEEIRHTLKHSQKNQAMTPEAELLLMNASRAQLVREVIRPALEAGGVVVCDRFYDSTTAYQGCGRELPMWSVKDMIDFAVGETRPDVTFLLQIPAETGKTRVARRKSRPHARRDRIEEADDAFFERVAKGYEAIAAANPGRVQVIDAGATIAAVSEEIWRRVEPLLESE